MTVAWPDTTRKAVKTTSAVVTLVAMPTIGPAPPNPSLRSTATTPKQVADSSGTTSWAGRTPTALPPMESSVVPATITSVPARIGSVTCSPSSTTASVVDTSGLRLISAALIDGPTVSMLMKRNSRPPTVPMSPASTKNAMLVAGGRPGPPLTASTSQKTTVPTSTLIHTPV